MDNLQILEKVDNPENVPIPCPTIEIEPVEDVLEGVATHLNQNETTIESLEGEDSEGDFTAEELRSRLPEPLMASSMPLFARINLTADMDTLSDEYGLEGRVVDALAHETMHIILFHLEGRETSIAFDELSFNREE